MHSKVKRNARRDKREYLEKLADDAGRNLDSGSGVGDKNAYRIVNEITSKENWNKRIPVKDKEVLITSEGEGSRCWVEHFCEVMNKNYK